MDEMTALATPDIRSDILQSVLIGGDLSKLPGKDLLEYYQALCASLKLNPLTKPFEKLTLGGKVILYATKSATDQLRMIHQVQLEIIKTEEVRDLYLVRVRATLPSGRSDEEIGAVPIKGLQGEALANAFMKATTKAKRRATLSVVGLSMLDEIELESLPRIERPATRETVVQAIEKPGAFVSEDTEVSAFLLTEIMNTLKRMAPSTSPEDREQRRHLLGEAFGVTGWSQIKTLSAARLQAGYAHLQELVIPEPSIDTDDDVPMSEPPDMLDVPQDDASLSDEGTDSSTEESLHSEDVSVAQDDMSTLDEMPEIEVDEEGFVTQPSLSLLVNRADAYGQKPLLRKIRGDAPRMLPETFRYAWVQVGLASAQTDRDRERSSIS